MGQCVAGELQVYKPGTVAPIADGTKAIGSGEPVPTGTTSGTPLIVIAPEPPTVWFRLYQHKGGGLLEAVGESVEIDPSPKNISALRKAVKAEFEGELTGISSALLLVYKPGTVVPIVDGTKVIDPGEPFSTGTTSEAPLIVIAPARPNTEQTESTTIRMSKPPTRRYENILNQLHVRKYVPKWENKPEMLENTPPYVWWSEEEDSQKNREEYMNYLRDNVTWPTETALFEVSNVSHLLYAQLQHFDFIEKMTGNIDVALADSNQYRETVRNNILCGIELKKYINESNKDLIDRQVTLQHLVASFLNRDTGILTLVTDLNDKWAFLWFSGEPEPNGRILMRYEAKRFEALYLIEHMLDDAVGAVSTPEGFLSRASWSELFSNTTEEVEGTASLLGVCDDHKDDDHVDDESGDEDEGDGAGRGSHSKRKAQDSKSSPSKTRKKKAKKGQTKRKQGKARTNSKSCGTRVATNDPYLDFMDEEEKRYEIFRMVLQTSFGYMLRPLDADSRKETGTSGPPTEIHF